MKKIALFTALVLSASAFQAAELKWTRSADSRQQVSVSTEVQLSFTRSDSDGEEANSETLRTVAVYEQQVVEAAGGRATSLRLNCSSGDRIVGLKKEDLPQKGRVFDVSLSKLGPVVTDSAGNPERAVGALGAWEGAAGLLPSAKTAVGKKWTVKAADLGGLVSMMGVAGAEGSLDATLESPLVVAFSGELKGTGEEGLAGTITIDKGTLEMGAGGAPVKIAIAGSFKMEKKVTRTRRVRKVDEEGNPVANDDGTPVFENVEDVMGSLSLTGEKLSVTVTFK